MSKSLGGPVMVIGTKLCEQFGIDPTQVQAVVLHLRVNEPARATVTLFPPQGGEVDVSEEIRRFEIIEVKEERHDDSD